jgi:hypothetical protein
VIGPKSQPSVTRKKGLRIQRIKNQLTITTREDEEILPTEKQMILRIIAREAKEP